MKTLIRNIFALTSAFLLQSSLLWSTPLDDYVAQPDPDYRWELNHVETTPEAKIYAVSLTSQKWRAPEEVDKPLWNHQLTVVVPTKLISTTALLSIEGGLQENDAVISPFDKLSLLELALKTNRIVCEVTMIPNQFLKFADERDERYLEKGRKEDALVAYTWDKFLNTGDATWPLRLPMTKSVVRAMDACEELLNQKQALPIDGFILIGKSKRGWTAWTTAAVDLRVKGIIPIVIDLFNLKATILRQYMAYGHWSPALRDYQDIHIPQRWDSEAFTQLMKIIEPYEYRQRLTMPKYLINATGDEFFLPDSSNFYFSALKGKNWLRYLPNTGHKIESASYLDSLIAYLNFTASDLPLPTASWQFTQDQQLVVTASTRPSKITLWQAHNPTGRDFRVVSIGKNWTSADLDRQVDNRFSVALKTPESGWSAYFIEITFPSPSGNDFIITTDVKILPDTYPGATQ